MSLLNLLSLVGSLIVSGLVIALFAVLLRAFWLSRRRVSGVETLSVHRNHISHIRPGPKVRLAIAPSGLRPATGH